MRWRTVTPVGASTVSTVGMSDGSRGASDWTCRPSGSDTVNATRVVEPAATASAATYGVTVAFGRIICASARGGALTRPSTTTNIGTSTEV
jgi:hypothetical protein